MRSIGIAGSGVLAMILLLLCTSVQSSGAYQSYFTSQCASCHTNDTPTCDGCHHHRGSLSAVANQATYHPGDPVTVTLRGGTQGGWIRAILYNESHSELTRATGPTGTGDDRQPHPVVFPVALHATAPLVPGDYAWQAAWYGNNGSSHLERFANVTIHVVQNPASVEDRPIVRRTWGRIRSLYR